MPIPFTASLPTLPGGSVTWQPFDNTSTSLASATSSGISQIAGAPEFTLNITPPTGTVSIMVCDSAAPTANYSKITTNFARGDQSGNLTGQVDLINSPNATALAAIATALLKLDWTTLSGEASESALNALRFLRNKWAVDGSGNLTVYKEDGATTAWTAVVTTNANAIPITGVS
jgi:hypothetical protein